MKIPTFILGNPKCLRNPLLATDFNKNFEVEFFSPIIYNSVSEAINETQLHKFEAVYFREPVVGEIGCAIAHQRMQSLIARNQLGGIVFEDDAFVLDYLNLEILFINFIKVAGNKPSLLNFTSSKQIEDFTYKSFESEIFQKRLPGPSPLACGYMLNSQAAKILSDLNTPFRFKADWPPADIQYFESSVPLVAHGSKLFQSTIEQGEIRRRINMAEKLCVILFLRYLTRKREFDSILDYYKLMIKPRVLNALNRLAR
jgi:hypothetical protein